MVNNTSFVIAALLSGYFYLTHKKGGKIMKEKFALEQITQSIRKFLFENYLFGYNENELSNNTSFLEFGVLDSMGIFELIGFIENEFDIEISYSEILPENLDSVNCVSSFIYKKMN